MMCGSGRDDGARSRTLAAALALLCWTGCPPQSLPRDAGAAATTTDDGSAALDARLPDAAMDSASLDGLASDRATGMDLGLGDGVATEAAGGCTFSCECPANHICDADSICKDRSQVFGPYLHPVCCLDPSCAGGHEPCENPDHSAAYCDALDAGTTDLAVADSQLADTEVADQARADTAAVDSAIPAEACPDLPIPSTCYNRSVIYRDWGPGAVGDGTYFVDQAPGRLGFTRNNGFIWIVKVRMEANTYFGRLSATGDSTPGAAWLSREPCNAADAFANGLATWGNTTGGMLLFVVARDDVDAERLRSDPDYAPSYGRTPQVRGGHCYYFVFENIGNGPPNPFDATYVATTADSCFDIYGNPGCWYLAMDFSHYLHDPTSGAVMSGSIIAGLTQP